MSTLATLVIRITADSSSVGRDAARAEPAARRSGERAGQQYSSGFVRGLGGLRSMVPILARGAGIAAVGVALAATAAHAIALGSAMAPALATVAAAPAVALTAAAAFGTLRMATSGLGAAWQATGAASAAGGSSAVSTARQVAAAQRELASAQRGVTDAAWAARQAQQAYTDAQRDAAAVERDLARTRAEAAERIEDLTRSLAGAQLDEESAVLAVARAKERLAAVEANPSSSALDSQEANLAYRQAEQQLAEVRDRVADLTAEQQAADKAGVEGSDEVQAALRRQEEAQRRVVESHRSAANSVLDLQEAQQRLLDSQRALAESGRQVGGAASMADAAMRRLAPAARELIITGRALAEVWQQRVVRAVQQRVWTGVAGDLQRLSGTYLPVAEQRLGTFGDAWNTAIRSALGLATTPAVVQDVDRSLALAGHSAEILAGTTQPLASILLNVGAVGAQFLPLIAGWVLELVNRFDRWVAAARESGQLAEWLGRGLDVLRQIAAIGGNVVGIIVAIFRAGGADAGGDMLSSLEAGTARLRDFLNSAEGQARIADVLDGIRAVIPAVVDGLGRLAAHAATLGPALSRAAAEGGAISDTFSVAGSVVGFLAGHVDTLAKYMPLLVAGFVAYKAAQAAANVASTVGVGLKVVEIATNLRLNASLRAHTVALGANTAVSRGATVAQVAETAAQNTGFLARARATVGIVAQRVASIAANIATKAWAAGQWLLNAALTANPIGLIIVAIVALVAGLIYAYTHSETFRNIVQAVFQAVAAYGRWLWENALKPYFTAIVAVFRVAGQAGLWLWENALKPAWRQIADAGRWLYDRVRLAFQGWKIIFDTVRGWVGGAKDWIVGKFNTLVGFVAGLPRRVRAAASGLWDGIWTGFRTIVNRIIAGWNTLSLTIGGGSILGMDIPSITLNTPNLPYLAEGGIVPATPGGRLVGVAEGGDDEAIAPLDTLMAMIREAVGGAGAGINVENLNVRAYSDRFSLAQVMDELAMHGVS